MKQSLGWLLSSTGGLAFLWVIIQFFIDRHDSSARRAVGAKTVSLQVEQVGLANFEDRLTTLSRLQDEEREYSDRLAKQLRQELGECRQRIEILENGRRVDVVWKRSAIRYIGVLRRVVNEYAPDHSIPSIPPELDLEE